MFTRGQRVRVEGYKGRKAILRVWEDKGHGLTLCSEAGYARAIEGGELVAVGFPMSDVRGLADQPPTGD